MVLVTHRALAQSSGGPGDVEELSLDALLEERIEIATRDARTTREAPNVVLVLSRDDILASGARDLLEVLQLVPGFTFHHDVTGAVGVAFRNLWGHEGKVLLMVDGLEVNELLYSTTQFGHHVLAHSIERVELIRGPGSALYGASAELAVINVVTRTGRALHGGELSGRAAGALEGLSDWSLAAAFGQLQQASELEWSVHAAGGEGRRTTRAWTDANGTVASLANEPLDPLTLTASLSWKALRARVLIDDQRIGARPAFGAVAPAADVGRFRTMIGDVQADLPIASHVTLRPHLNARLQTPWQTTDPDSESFYDKSAARLLAGLGASWTPVPTFTLSGSLDAFWDHAWLNDQRLIGLQTQFGSSNTVSYSNVAAWLQAQWDTPYVNVTLGGRLEWNSVVGVNVAPRLALTRQFGRVNVKLLAAGAFRNPGIENLNLGSVRPERTRVGEAEVGIAIGDYGYASVNGFYSALLSPIIYGVDPSTGTESYRNGGLISTAGAETTFRLRAKRGSLTLTGALAVPVVTQDVDTYLVPGTSTLLAMPLGKLTGFGKYTFGDRFSLGGHFVFHSGRQAFVTPSDLADGTLVVGSLPATLLLSVWVGVDSLFVDGLSGQLGVGNVLGANVLFAQPYDGGIPPLPGRGREVFVRLAYAFGAPVP
jgi:outer membrane receptor protein involved in Fe transport